MAKIIVVIGATGHFGGRLCRRIVTEKNTELVLTSRSESRAQSLANELLNKNPEATIRATQLDQTSPDFENALQRLRPDIVIHTAGPYQGQDYRVANACIDCGSHYIDLADGRDFVQGFTNLHERAQDRGVLLVSGASTLPGLSGAVVDLLEEHFASIHSIETSIAPGHQTPRGAGTVAAVLSYCGKPFPALLDGEWVTLHGWQNMKTQRYPALGFRLSAACDVPDLGVFPESIDGLRTVTFHAALEAKWEQLALWLMGGLTRLRIIKDWSRFVPAFLWVSDRLIKLGSDTGGMRIKISGVGNDQNAKSLTWILTARQNHGPEIPCSPALILARKLVAGDISTRGAFRCVGLFTIAEFDAEVSEFDIDWSVHESS